LHTLRKHSFPHTLSFSQSNALFVRLYARPNTASTPAGAQTKHRWR
jgi:hypothetical protein